jgi:hypothetical protein
MCAVSFVSDHFLQKPNWNIPITQTQTIYPQVTREEFEQLKKEVLEMKELVMKAKVYDDANNQPHCENQEKIEMIKRIADFVGVDMSDVVNALKD